ncbi:carbohydrate ABC transporter permease [Thalassovita taeanensis]|uniref:Multiple sugar transport system permease protein n=1 Tax=Thalassovita taeanensis TaxID=657014 RepID=A0A1H9JX23_9RHOB|nr:sugar ABC transporter permease [Thalassovita taeanensis]SEQ91055.1 multiple sugar transport system permease protein [Thalassovita taeanensis]
MRVVSKERAQARLAYLLVLPATLLILLIYILPIVTVFGISFTDYSLVSDYYEFVGLQNYAQMLEDEAFGNALRNTLIYAGLFLPGAFIISLILAIAIQERKKFRSILEVLYFLPVTSTLAAMALVWAALMDSNQGVINLWAAALGAGPFNWLGSENLVLVSMALISLWSVIGFNMVLFLAGLTAIPVNLYEAAAIDGADHPVDKFLRVTWPMLGPTSMFVAVTSSITAFKLFDTVAILTQGGPDRSSEVFLYLTFLEGFEYFNMGYSAALSLVFLGIIFVFALIQALFVDRNVQY